VKQKHLPRSLWDKSWHFEERNRRPPRDPVNALLSLSYTIIGNSIGQLATIRGLDISFEAKVFGKNICLEGFLHIPHKGRPSLALDLVEPVRPWVDQWLWQNIQKTELLTPKHFTLSNELVSR
jgi:CRISPR-associated protein Cas1